MASKAKAKSKARKRTRTHSRVKVRSAPRVGAAGERAVPARTDAHDLLARLKQGGVICAEGYVFELERRGYLQAGAFVPEVLFDHPEVVEQLHLDFVHAGSDVTQALTYYVHREKLRVIGREKDLVPMNRAALKIAKSVARRTGTLFAGDLCNTNIYDPADPAAQREVGRIFAEQVGWAADAGVDYFVGETFSWGAEALLALAAIRKYSKVPAVITMAMHREDVTREGWTAA
jgi:betaine-homocysteine S-methyltransferase